MNAAATTLEDELGDILEKALGHAGMAVDALARETGIEEERLRDALDYRYDLDCGELQRIARVLCLNEVGLCALGRERYPLPDLPELPFCFRPLPMRYGVGVVNAHLACAAPDAEPVLFDAGTSGDALREAWGKGWRRLAAVFVTHGDRDHVGGLGAVLDAFPGVEVYGPSEGAGVTRVLREGDRVEIAGLRIETYATPGHAASHNSYRVGLAGGGREVLVSGDILFAGSIGRAFFSPTELRRHARRLVDLHAGDTLLAPGHGPLTTVGNERRFNPFLL